MAKNRHGCPGGRRPIAACFSEREFESLNEGQHNVLYSAILGNTGLHDATLYYSSSSRRSGISMPVLGILRASSDTVTRPCAVWRMLSSVSGSTTHT